MDNRFACPRCGNTGFTVWASESGVYQLSTESEAEAEEPEFTAWGWDQREGWGFHAVFAAYCDSCGNEVGALLAERMGTGFQPEAMARFEAQP